VTDSDRTLGFYCEMPSISHFCDCSVPYFISHTKLHVSQLSGIKPRQLLVIGNDSKGRYQSKYYTTIITMVPSLHIEICIDNGPCLI